MAEIVSRYLSTYAAMSFSDMRALYSPEFTFTDPAFGPLSPSDSRGMFRMFTSSQSKTNLVVTVTSPPTEVAPNTYKAVYTCDYTFVPGRQVHNVITATVTVNPTSGKIASQVDEFDMGGWAWQAGGVGLWVVVKLTGGKVVVKRANARLAAWEKANPMDSKL